MAEKVQEGDPARRKADEDSASENGERPEEFERFEELAQKLAQVPKSEVDEKRKAS